MGYHLLIFTEFVPNVETRYLVGWSAIGFTLIVILANIGVMVYINVSKISRSLYLRRKKKEKILRAKMLGVIKTKRHNLILEKLQPKSTFIDVKPKDGVNK